jgi:hypothetical protein
VVKLTDAFADALATDVRAANSRSYTRILSDTLNFDSLDLVQRNLLSWFGRKAWSSWAIRGSQ